MADARKFPHNVSDGIVVERQRHRLSRLKRNGWAYDPFSRIRKPKPEIRRPFTISRLERQLKASVCAFWHICDRHVIPHNALIAGCTRSTKLTRNKLRIKKKCALRGPAFVQPESCSCITVRRSGCTKSLRIAHSIFQHFTARWNTCGEIPHFGFAEQPRPSTGSHKLKLRDFNRLHFRHIVFAAASAAATGIHCGNKRNDKTTNIFHTEFFLHSTIKYSTTVKSPKNSDSFYVGQAFALMKSNTHHPFKKKGASPGGTS